RAAARDRLQGRDLHAPGAQRHVARHLREGLRPLAAPPDSLGLRQRAAAPRPRAHRAVARARLPPLPGDGARRHQARRQRSLHLFPRRQPARGPRAGTARLLVRLRRDGRFQPGGRGGPRAVAVDGQRRPRLRCLGDGRRTLRRVATRRYTNAKVRENYARRFSIRFPNEELPAARPQQTTALYDLMLAQGAVMGDSWGLEAPLWFAPRGVEARDVVSFHRSNDFAHVKAECHGVRNAVGATEIANFAKYEFEGAGAEGCLSRLMTNRMPRHGRLVLTPMLNEGGKLIGDFTIAKAAADRFLIWGSSQAQIYHMRWFEQHLPRDSSVRVRRLGLGLVGLSIAGPRSRELLAHLTDADVSDGAL